MANSPQARKRARQAQKKRLHNDSLESEMRTYIKRVRTAVDKKELDNANTVLKQAISKIDSLAGKRVIHPNRASRLKSRLNKSVKVASQEQ